MASKIKQFIFFISFLEISFLFAKDFCGGFADSVLGGGGGTIFLVGDAESLKEKLALKENAIVVVSGMIDVRKLKDACVNIASNKTLEGKDTKSGIIGTINIKNAVNVIVRGLNITNPGSKVNAEGKYEDSADGISVRSSKNVLITHCTFYDCSDGMCDITEASNKITVSWCKFYYTDKNLRHKFTMLLGLQEGTMIDATLHHNWWGDNCDQRMPSSSYARVHQYNNYFSCKGNYYCSQARKLTQILSENNFYENVRNPLTIRDGGFIRESGNIYKNCTDIPAKPFSDAVFEPPYSYKLIPAAQVPEIVCRFAGNTAGSKSNHP